MKVKQLQKTRKIKVSKTFAIIDQSDYKIVSKYKWYLSSGYATAHEKQIKGVRPSVFMHRLVRKTPDGLFTDHINRNKLDNRKSNLRVCLAYQNMANVSKLKVKNKIHSNFRGVCWDANRWLASVKSNNKLYKIGRFKSELHAAMARDIAAKDLQKEFTFLNFKEVCIYKTK